MNHAAETVDLRPKHKTSPNLFEKYDKDVPHVVKYMGSKKSILDFVIKAINENYHSGYVCDLFAGTSILSGALGKTIPMHSNDIQEYSSILARTYLLNLDKNEVDLSILDEITKKASRYVDNVKRKFPLSFDYSTAHSLHDFVQLEKQQQNLINLDFDGLSHHLFIKYYSGTYWSFEQCLWIDAFRKVADDYENTNIKYLIMSSLMYAMSYNSQSTGHFAQFRDATDESSKEDILIYRQKKIQPFFQSKFKQLYNFCGNNQLQHKVTTLDYSDCLDVISPDSLVYADPPYAFVHYSRFYHALETVVKYDYPSVRYKGRYRKDRHQSPFCKRTEVRDAFGTLFSKIREKNCSLILSYSNTGMISLDEILHIAHASLSELYELSVREVAYKHSTMGRKDDKTKDVSEYLVIAKHC